MNKEFLKKNIFVAGGSSGINFGIANGFATRGATVGILSRTREKVESACAALRQSGTQTYGYTADVRNFDAVASAISSFAEANGSIDVVVSGAAGNFQALAADLSSNGFKTVIDIDLLGTFHVMKAAFPFLTRPGASLINISAPQSWVPLERQVHACAAKAGVDQVTRTLALEWGKEGIRVNSIAPGAIDNTEGMRRLGPQVGEILKAIPLGRMGTVADIADVAAFLASDASRYVSGAVIPVDGGCGTTGAARAFDYKDN